MKFVVCFAVLAVALADDPNGQFGAPHNVDDALSYKPFGGHALGHGLGLGYHAAVAPAVAHPAVPLSAAYPLLHHHHDDAYKMVVLTCATADSATNKMSINIKQKKFSAWNHHYTPGLEATANVEGDGSNVNGDFSIVFSDMVRDDCDVAGMGNLVCPKNYIGYGLHAHPGSNYGFDLEAAHPIPGVLTTGTFNDNKASIYVDRLYGYQSLAELAGRGVSLCPKDWVKQDSNGHWECQDPTPDSDSDDNLFACCSLQYSNIESFLSS